MREWLISFLIVTTVLLAIVLLIVPFFQFQKYTALDEEFVFKVLPYFIPISLVYIIPLAVLLSCIFVFGRLSEDNEILAIKSSGIPLLRVIRPIFFLTIFLSIGIFMINTQLIPYCHSKTRQLTISAFKNRIFSDSQGADEIKLPDGKISYANRDKGVFNSVRLLKFDPNKEELMEELSAQNGKFELDEENAMFSLNLNNVYITMWEQEKQTSQYTKKESTKRTIPHLVKSGGHIYRLDVSNLFAPSRKNLASLTNSELDRMLVEYKNNPTKTRQALSSKHQRYSSGLTPLIFAFIGIPIGILIRKGSRVAGVGISMLIVFVGYYPLMMLSNLVGTKKDILPVSISVWLSNIVFGLVGLILLYYIIKHDK
ncbi:MAG: LptF/LptG family permease [Planctomycetota bacterium]